MHPHFVNGIKKLDINIPFFRFLADMICRKRCQHIVIHGKHVRKCKMKEKYDVTLWKLLIFLDGFR